MLDVNGPEEKEGNGAGSRDTCGLGICEMDVHGCCFVDKLAPGPGICKVNKEPREATGTEPRESSERERWALKEVVGVSKLCCHAMSGSSSSDSMEPPRSGDAMRGSSCR